MEVFMMKKLKSKLMRIVLFMIILFIFSSCTITIGPLTTNYNITINNDTFVTITILLSGGLPSYDIASGGSGTYSLPLGTVIVVRRTSLPLMYFYIDDDALHVDTDFVLDGAGYTLYAEYGANNPYSLRVTRVL